MTLVREVRKQGYEGEFESQSGGRRAVIIGAGLGGLSAGIHLQREGWQVTILEQNSRAGGRMNLLEVDGFRFDTGPTLLMMPDALQSLFQSCGERLEDYLELVRLDPAYEVQFADGSQFKMHSKLAALEAEARRFSASDAARLPALFKAMGRRYRNARYNFIERPFNRVSHLLRPSSLQGLARSLPLESVYSFVSRYIQDSRLREALTFQTLYLGISPYDCPSIYALLPYIEMEYGVWYPRGGMIQVANSLVRLFQRLGGSISYRRPVEEIHVERGRAGGVRTRDGKLLPAEVVVANLDVPSVYKKLVPTEFRRWNNEDRLDRQEVSCSAYLLFLGVRDLESNWGHHTVLLSEDYQAVLEEIMHRQVLPTDPAMYVCIPTRTDPSLAPEGHDSVYVLTIVPNQNGEVSWEEELPLLRERVLEKLERTGIPGLRQKIVVERSFAPPDFAREYGCFAGSAFGLAPTFLQSAYWRPHNRCRDLPGLYFAGASTHPGGGIPMVLTSGRLAAEQIVQDFAVSPSFWPARRPGRVAVRG